MKTLELHYPMIQFLIICVIIWLAPWAGKMNQIARCDWLPERPSCPLGTTRCIPQAKFHQKPYNKSFIDQACSVKMAGYWPCSFFASLWTLTSSRSINMQKKNLANIQPTWPHTWSITHTYYMALSHKDWELPNLNLIGWNGYWPRSRFSHLDRHLDQECFEAKKLQAKMQNYLLLSSKNIYFRKCPTVDEKKKWRGRVNFGRIKFGSSPFATKITVSTNQLLETN